MQNTYQRVKIPLKLNKDFSKTFGTIQPLRHPWAYGKEKFRGAENVPDFFGLCPTSPEKIVCGTN